MQNQKAEKGKAIWAACGGSVQKAKEEQGEFGALKWSVGPNFKAFEWIEILVKLQASD